MLNPKKSFLKPSGGILFLLGLSFASFAQVTPSSNTVATAPTTPMLRVKSPEVLTNNRVTVRLAAPSATSVTISGDWKPGAAGRETMVKSDSGTWTVTVGPLKPEIYGYTFSVDGVTTLDPNNVQTRRDGTRYFSQLLIPGNESTLYAVNNVPHGTLSQIWYDSPALRLNRRMYVYTPNGYEQGTTRYPVLYLLHGGGGDEDAWTTMGSACQILDNLMAQGNVKPMIVVMTNGNANQTAAQNYTGTQPSPTGPMNSSPLGDITRFPRSLVSDVVPFVDKSFRTKPDRQNRAIAGLSMGGAQTLYASFNNLELFAWVASFSGGFPLLPGVAVPIPAPANAASLRGPDLTKSIDPVKFAGLHPQLDASVNSKLRLFYLAIGTDDALISTHNDVKKLLDGKGVKYTLVERPGYAHEWSFWRLSLTDLLPRLF